MMTEQVLCCRGRDCVHPDGPLLPQTTDYFHRDKSRPSGFRPECKECVKRRQSKYDMAERTRIWNNAHPEQVREYQRRYRKKHSNRLNRKKRAYYKKNKEKILARQREYRRENREKVNARQRERRKEKALERHRLETPLRRAKRIEAQEQEQRARHEYVNQKLAEYRNLNQC